MSGSPKYTTVAYDAAREAARRRRLAEQRRRQAEERRRRAAEAAARRARAEAEIIRRNAELAAQRAAKDAAAVAAVRAAGDAVAARNLDEVDRLIAQARTLTADAAQLDRCATRAAELRTRLAQGFVEPLDGAIEELRGWVVRAGSPAPAGPAAGTDHAGLLAHLAHRLAAPGPQGADLDDAGHRRCTALLDELQAAAQAGQHVRFEALLGTAEHEVDRHAATVAERVGQAAERARDEAAADRAREAADRARKAEAQAREVTRTAALAEARDRLDVLSDAVRTAIGDARRFAADDLSEQLAASLAQAELTLRAGVPQPALDAVADLERQLPQAESRLDELLLAHERRVELARAVTEAMTGEGFAFVGGDDLDTRFLLHFERPNGALYETAVGSEADGTPLLVYRVEGEADVALQAADGHQGAVCDTTEELLDRVHDAMAEDGFVPGELTWQGKPPRSGGRTLPGDGAARHR